MAERLLNRERGTPWAWWGAIFRLVLSLGTPSTAAQERQGEAGQAQVAAVATEPATAEVVPGPGARSQREEQPLSSK